MSEPQQEQPVLGPPRRQATITITETTDDQIGLEMHFVPPFESIEEAKQSPVARLASLAFATINQALDVTSIGGMCRKCGCTDDHPCEGGCAWVDPEHTLCSQCADAPVIVDPTGAPANPRGGIIT